jgi:phosphoserine aminotransferase
MKKPDRGKFSSGPCAKPATWTAPIGETISRSHRSKDGLGLIQQVIELQRKILKIPSNYLLGLVPASASGAMEMLLWSLLGERGVDVLACCVFSNCWAHDIVDELKISDTRLIKENFPYLSDVRHVNFNRDLVFCLSATTSGASFHDLDWIPDNRKGLVICDAASAVFTMDFDWNKLDAIAFSWQKGLGGEGGFGTIVLGPRAISRLESYEPARAIPRIFRISNDKKVKFDLFDGYTINTPSMLCLEDFRNNLAWANNLGGLGALVQRVKQNYDVVQRWIGQQKIFCFFVEEKQRAQHITCLDITSQEYRSKSEKDKWIFLGKIVEICEEENVGFDFLGHTFAKPSLRIWMGPTIESQDLEMFLPWLEVAYNRALNAFN